MIGPLRGPAGRSGTTSSTICGVASAGDVLSTLSRVGRGRGGGAGLRAGGGRDGTFFARPSFAFFGSSAEPVWRAASDGDSGSPHTSWSASGTTCSSSASGTTCSSSSLVRRDCADAGAESAGLDAGGAVSESVDSGSAGCAGTARLTSCTAPSFCGCAGGGGAGGVFGGGGAVFVERDGTALAAGVGSALTGDGAAFAAAGAAFAGGGGGGGGAFGLVGLSACFLGSSTARSAAAAAASKALSMSASSESSSGDGAGGAGSAARAGSGDSFNSGGGVPPIHAISSRPASSAAASHSVIAASGSVCTRSTTEVARRQCAPPASFTSSRTTASSGLTSLVRTRKRLERSSGCAARTSSSVAQ